MPELATNSNQPIDKANLTSYIDQALRNELGELGDEVRREVINKISSEFKDTAPMEKADDILDEKKEDKLLDQTKEDEPRPTVTEPAAPEMPPAEKQGQGTQIGAPPSEATPTTEGGKPEVPEEEAAQDEGEEPQTEDEGEEPQTEEEASEKPKADALEEFGSKPEEEKGPAAGTAPEKRKPYDPFSKFETPGAAGAPAPAKEEPATPTDKKPARQATSQKGPGVDYARQKQRTQRTQQTQAKPKETSQSQQGKSKGFSGFYFYFVIFVIRDIILLGFHFIPLIGGLIIFVTLIVFSSFMIFSLFVYQADKTKFIKFCVEEFIGKSYVYGLLFPVTHSIILLVLHIKYKKYNASKSITGAVTSTAKQGIGASRGAARSARQAQQQQRQQRRQAA